MNDQSNPPAPANGEEHVLGADGKFHVTDEPVDLSIYGWEDWISFVLFWLLIDKIGQQRMAIVDLPMVLVFGPMMFGFTIMFWRSVQVALRHWRSGYSVLERPEVALEGGER